MTEIKTWTRATVCEWEGQPTTIGAVVAEYKRTRPAYAHVVPRAIANGGVTNHSELLSYDLAIVARRKAGGTAAVKRKPCHFRIGKGKN